MPKYLYYIIYIPIADRVVLKAIYVVKKIYHCKTSWSIRFCLSNMYFSRHMNSGKCFVLF